MARRSFSPRHIAEIGPRQEFKFTDAQWGRIAAEMPCAQDVGQYRESIEGAAAWLVYRRQNPELSPGYRPPPRDKIVSKKIKTAARNLSRALDELSGFARMHLEGMFGAMSGDLIPLSDKQAKAIQEALKANDLVGLLGVDRLKAAREGPIVDRAQRLAAFKADVDRIAHYAPYFLKGIGSQGPKQKGKADPARIIAWANASSWWEDATGKEATANPKSGAYASREPDGSFVRFIQAFSAAIPGERKPTGFHVGTFIQTYWAGGKKEYLQTGKW